MPERLSLVHAQARSRLGHADAGALADSVIGHMYSAGFGKLMLGLGHETRARIALSFEDSAGFEHHAARCRELWSAQKNGALTAKCHRLTQDGRRVFEGGETNARAQPDSQASSDTSRIDQALANCPEADQRAQLALTFLTRQSRASAGFLFALGDDGPYCAAQIGTVGRAELWLQPVTEYLELQCKPQGRTSTLSGDDQPATLPWVDEDGREFRPVLLVHNDKGDQIITGIAVLLNEHGERFVRPASAAAAVSRFYSSIGSRSLSLLVE